jgi:hypothetical protein
MTDRQGDPLTSVAVSIIYHAFFVVKTAMSIQTVGRKAGVSAAARTPNPGGKTCHR